MNIASPIKYIKNSAVDKARWDECIRNSASGLVYAYSFYLDTMAPGWDALIWNDYEKVMPLTWNKKWGIAYLYQPFLTAQLGVFGNDISAEEVSAFIKKATEHFKFIEISLNFGNITGPITASYTERKNYVLPLQQSYDNLRIHYSENTQRNIKKCRQSGAVVQTNFDVDKVITLAIQQMQLQGNTPGENVERFRKLYQLLQEKQMATTYGIFSPSGELLASAAFLFSHDRAYYILVGNNPEGRTTGASHALIDAFIKDHAGKNMVLDFEGSDIPTLAQFYSSFGAVNEPYPTIRINRLPFYLKWLKK